MAPLRKSGPLKPAGKFLSTAFGVDREDVVFRNPDGSIERRRIGKETDKKDDG